MPENDNAYHALGVEIGQILRNATSQQPAVAHVDSSPFAAAMAEGMQRTREVMERQNEQANQELRACINAFIERADDLKPQEIDLDPVTRAIVQLSERRQEAISDAQLRVLTAAIESIVTQLSVGMEEMADRLSSVETALRASKRVQYDGNGRVKQVDVIGP